MCHQVSTGLYYYYYRNGKPTHAVTIVRHMVSNEHNSYLISDSREASKLTV